MAIVVNEAWHSVADSQSPSKLNCIALHGKPISE